MRFNIDPEYQSPHGDEATGAKIRSSHPGKGKKFHSSPSRSNRP